MYKLRRMTGESLLEQCLFCYPKRPGAVIVLLVITILGFFMTTGTFAKSGVANECPLSLTQMIQKIKSAEERFTVYRCEWVVARFQPVHPKVGNETARWAEPWCRPIMDKVLGRGLSWPEATTEDIECMGKLMDEAANLE